MTREQFLNYVMAANSELGMTAEEFARAVGQPVEAILARAKAAGIIMKREGFAIARDIPKATSSDRCCVEDRGFRNPFER